MGRRKVVREMTTVPLYSYTRVYIEEIRAYFAKEYGFLLSDSQVVTHALHIAKDVLADDMSKRIVQSDRRIEEELDRKLSAAINVAVPAALREKLNEILAGGTGVNLVALTSGLVFFRAKSLRLLCKKSTSKSSTGQPSSGLLLQVNESQQPSQMIFPTLCAAWENS